MREGSYIKGSHNVEVDVMSFFFFSHGHSGEVLAGGGGGERRLALPGSHTHKRQQNLGK